MNDTTKIFVQIGFAIAVLYLYKQFLENIERENLANTKRHNDMMLDFFNSLKPPQAQESTQ